jgi:fructose/tagatose bisphosphate aldolase
LNLNRLEHLHSATCVPLVLHGGSGIKQDNVREAMQRGIAKINVATEIRQPYEVTLKEKKSFAKAQQAVYERTAWILKEYLGIAGIRAKVVA